MRLTVYATQGAGMGSAIIEQDHRFVNKRVMASQWLRSADGALNTIAGYEAMSIIRQRQIRRPPISDIVGQLRFVEHTFGIAANAEAD